MVYIAKNVDHEVRVRMSMILSVGNTMRKCIAYSPQQVLAFINEWNLQHKRVFNLPQDKLLAFPKYDPQ